MLFRSPGGLDTVHAYHPNVIKTDEYKMWYSGEDGVNRSILYANSTDGINWNKYPRAVSPAGPNRVYGDANVIYPEVLFHNGEYKLWYSRFDGRYMRTMFAISTDGINWVDQGMALDVGASGQYDSFRASQGSVMIIGNETKIWYSAYNNTNWRIMYANLTPNMTKTDISLTWDESTSTDIIRYEVYRESRPSAFNSISGIANPEFYDIHAGRTPWAMEKKLIENQTIYGPITGSEPPSVLLPEDNIQDIEVYQKPATQEWIKLTPGVDYTIDTISGLIDFSSIYPFTAGDMFFANYNYSAGKALTTSGSSIIDSLAGKSSNQTYYYKIRAVDKAGNIAETRIIMGKLARETGAGWSLVSSPFLNNSIPVSDALSSLDWAIARTWDPLKLPNHWTINDRGSQPALNSLFNVSSEDGIWVYTNSGGNFPTVGKVMNITLNLKAGWNLISYPHHEIMTVSDALAGLPWDRARSEEHTSELQSH